MWRYRVEWWLKAAAHIFLDFIVNIAVLFVGIYAVVIFVVLAAMFFSVVTGGV